jgi:hypothetical protein
LRLQFTHMERVYRHSALHLVAAFGWTEPIRSIRAEVRMAV